MKKNKTKSLLSLLSVSTLIFASCASSPDKIAATYVSPVKYTNYDCEQLIAEEGRLSQRVSDMAGNLQKASDNDKGLTAVGTLIFWPALFALGGNKEQEQEFARLKGEYNAVEEAMVTKKCTLPKTTESTPSIIQ